MYFKIIKRIIFVSIFFFLTVSSVSSMKNVNTNNSYEINSVFVIDVNVKLYNDEISVNAIDTLNYFDSLIVLSASINNKDRIKVKLLNGNEGWIDEKYTSYISKDWLKKQFDEDYYCYILPTQKMSFTKKKYDVAVGYEYKNRDYNIIFGINYELGYTLIKNQYERGIMRSIDSGDDKKLNWSKEFIYGNYKINYVITTDDPNGWIIESIDFVKLNEQDLKKTYSFSTTYKPSSSLEKKMVQRKILFSTLQSLK